MEQLWLKRNGSCHTSRWAGGETTEFFIYPETGSYADRQFDFRISSATVAQQRSQFSSLSGFYRYLMPLDQPITLIHEGHGVKELAPLELAPFDGGWATESVGKCRDFNIMLNQKEGWQARVDVIRDSGTMPSSCLFTGFYVQSESITITSTAHDFSFVLNTGDFLLLKSDHPIAFSISCSQSSFKLIQFGLEKL